MKVDPRFLRHSAVAYVGIVPLSLYFLSSIVGAEVLKSAIGGCVLSLVNLVCGYVSIELGFPKPNAMFLKIVLGGTVVRLIMMWVMFMILVGPFGFHQEGLVYSLLALYVVNLVLEISFLQRRTIMKT